jgi:8-oxo-dGTP pyrophosphatase MutT (NUDIX family)
VRAIVLRDDRVLVVNDLSGTTHILPGGRIEEGEARPESLSREVLEESGWAIDRPVKLGVRHFHHLQPVPRAYAFSYPDFLQEVYVAHATDLLPEAREVGGFAVDCRFLPASTVADMPLTLGEQTFLQAALESGLQAAR